MNAAIIEKQTEATIAKLSQAYANNQLNKYRVLKLKDSHNDQSTCNMQWGPQMRT